MQFLADTDVEQWRAIQAVNVEGVFLGCKYGVAAMSVGGRERGGAGGGAIVNMSSVAGLIGAPGAIAYGASKGAVRQLTKSVAIDCAKKGLGIPDVRIWLPRRPSPGKLDFPESEENDS